MSFDYTLVAWRSRTSLVKRMEFLASPSSSSYRPSPSPWSPFSSLSCPSSSLPSSWPSFLQVSLLLCLLLHQSPNPSFRPNSKSCRCSCCRDLQQQHLFPWLFFFLSSSFEPVGACDIDMIFSS